MKFLRSTADLAEVRDMYDTYRSYLEQHKDRFPANAYAFACAPWHYDSTDHRCPHDSWMESLAILEPSSGARHETRCVDILLRLKGAYHDGYIEIRYAQVLSYDFSLDRSKVTKGFWAGRAAHVGHGDWLFDELVLTDDGLVSHEIEFEAPGRWCLVCRDVTYSWLPD